MWYFAWMLGVGFALLLAILNAMWGENEAGRALSDTVKMPCVANPQPTSHIHLLSLVIALAIMLACTLYPPMMAASNGKPDHALATALFTAM